MALREILLELGIDVDDKGAEKTITNIRKGLKRMGDTSEKATKKAQKGVRSLGSRLTSLKTIALGAAAIFATGALARGFSNLIGLASSAEETANKFGAVFKDASKTTQKALEDISKRTGASTLQLQEFTSRIGAIVKPALGSSDAAGVMASGIAALSLDIASFNDLEPEVALQKLQSGLIGSTEPLDAVGVNLRKNNLDLDTFAKSLGKTAKSLTQGELIQARYNAIVKQLKDQGALGDAEKTSRDFANASRNLRGRLKEVAALLGGFFLKSAKGATNGLRDIVDGVFEFVKTNKDAIQQGVDKFIETLGRVFGALGDVLNAVVVQWKFLTGIMGENNRVLSSLILGFGILIAILGLPVVLLLAIGAAIFLIIDDFRAMGEGAESVTGTIIQGFQDLVKEVGSIPAAIFEMFTTALAFWSRGLAKLFGFTDEEIDNFIGALGDTLNKFWTELIQGWKQIFVDLFDFVVRKAKQLARFAGIGEEEHPAAAAARVGQVAARAIAPGVNLGGLIPQAPTAAGAAGATTMINQPRTNINVEVTANQASGTPQDIADAVSQKINEVQENQNRQTQRAFATALPEG